MNDLYEVLEICLQEIEQGADLETVLFQYPERADELRPILEGSLKARSMAIAAPSAEVVRRNRFKVLGRATQLRAARAKSPQRSWFASVRRVAVTLAVVLALFVSGTGLVHAASTTLPGDQLYPVKRTWEDMSLLFTFNIQQRETLEVEHENERLQELREVFAKGRSAEVEFAGVITSQNGNEWIVAGFPVVTTAQTEGRNGPFVVGSAVRVKGHTQANGAVLAEKVELLPPGAILPDEAEIEEESHEGVNPQSDDHSGSGSETETPKIEETQTPESESNLMEESLSGSESVDIQNSDSSSDSGSNNKESSDHSGSKEGGDSHHSGEDSGAGDSSSSGGEDH